MAAACLWYPAFVYHIPQWAIKKLNEALWTFLWGNKKDPVRRDIAVLPFDMGGLRIVDLEKKSQAIKMSWIAKLFDENCPGKFKYTMIEILNQYKQANFGKNVFKTFISLPAARQLPTYYSKMLTVWDNLIQDKRCRPTNINRILTEPLFNNTFLTTGSQFDKKLIFFPNWGKINKIRQVTYEVVPKMLPVEAIKELLESNDKRIEKQHKRILESIPRDWKDCLNSKTGKPDETFYICRPTNINRILTEPLFNNTFLTTGSQFDKKLIFFPNWGKINKIRKVTYEVVPKMLPVEAIKELLESNDKRIEKQHKRILESIPRDWKDCLNSETGKPDETFYIQLSTDTKPKLVTELNCNTLYNILLTKDASSVYHTYRPKWASTLGSMNWGKIFKDIQKNNIDRKANDLRWKIPHRCIPTARRLAGRSPFFLTNTCQICKQYEENLTHLFYLCHSAKKIWNYVTTLIRQRFPSYSEYHISFKDILTDFENHDELRNPVTGLLRDTGLRHIWQYRNQVVYENKTVETLSVFKAKLRQKIKTEFQIAKVTGKIETFRKNWAHHNYLTEIQNNSLILHF